MREDGKGRIIRRGPDGEPRTLIALLLEVMVCLPKNLYPDVLMMQSAENRDRRDVADPVTASDERCVFVQR